MTTSSAAKYIPPPTIYREEGPGEAMEDEDNYYRYNQCTLA